MPIQAGPAAGRELRPCDSSKSVGLLHVAEPGLATDSGARCVGHACQIGRQLAHVRATAVFVADEVPHEVNPILDVPDGLAGLGHIPVVFVADDLSGSVDTGIFGPFRTRRNHCLIETAPASGQCTPRPVNHSASRRAVSWRRSFQAIRSSHSFGMPESP